MLCSLEYQTMDKVRKPSNPECYTPSSEPFRIYLHKNRVCRSRIILIRLQKETLYVDDVTLYKYDRKPAACNCKITGLEVSADKCR
jgi:hypothetical protein